MWKRIMIALFMLLSAFSVGYAYYNFEIKANNIIYQAGGSVTGRINTAPNGIEGKNIGMQKGDKFFIGAVNPKNGYDLGFMLISYNENYNDYITDAKTTPIVYGNDLSGWLTLSTESIAEVNPTESASDFKNQSSSTKYLYVKYKDSKIAPEIAHLTSSFQNSPRASLLLPRDISNLRLIVQNSFSYTVAGGDIVVDSYEMGNTFFTFSDSTYVKSGLSSSYDTSYTGSLAAKDLTFSSDYWTVANYYNPYPYVWEYMDGTTGETVGANYGYSIVKSVRPAAFFDLKDVVFGVSKGSNHGIANVTESSLPAGYTSLWNSVSTASQLKLRIKNSNLNATLNELQFNQNNIDTIVKDMTIQISGNANSGNDLSGNPYTVSAIVFDEKNNFKYYKPLESAKGNGLYAFDLTGIPAGKYKIGIVNEAYNENSTIPADSSSITDVRPLEIVEPLSDLSFTPQSNLQVNQNVNVGDKVGSISSKNGAGSPQYTLIEDSAYPGEADQLEIGSNGTSVVVKNSALHAGTYHFKIQAQDETGNPSTPLEIKVSITVGKASLTIAFDNPNQVKKSIADASASWIEKATVNPNAGTKITYTKSGGTIGLIDINPDSGAIKYIGNGSFGKVTIKATADDDASTGNDDYQAAETTKEIVIFREVDGSVTPHTNSSSTSSPTFQTSDANIKPNGVIGKIVATLGTPNNGTSGATTYTYGLKQVDDYNYFSVNTSTGEIKTTADLSSNIGNYSITVTVSDQWSTKEIPVNISVGLSPAENLKFYENTTSNTIITTKSAALTDTNVTVFATVKGSSNNNPVTYRLKDGEPTNVIDVNPNSGAITIKNVGTVVIVAEKQGSGGQADAITELTFTVTAGSQEFIYTDASGNELPKSGNNYDDYSEVYGKGKTFQLYTSGNPQGTTVTYALQTGSPTDVISVDPNGLVSIYNASLNTQVGKVIVEATSHDPTGNYSDKTIELPINITKANQTISFKDVTPAQNGKGKVTPIIIAQNISSNEGGVMINDTNYYISVDSSENGIAWTNNGKDIEYNYSGDTTKEIPLHVEKAGNRNYNKTEADGKMRILSPDESSLSINQPGKIYYGDHFTLRSLQDDSSSSNVKYTFEVDNTIFVSSPTVKGNLAEFDALKCSDGSKINITVTRTADGEVTLSKKITIEVLPKDINITIDDKTKQKGEENPPLTFQDFTSQLVRWNGVQDVVDLDDVVLSTTATTTSKAGSYPITGNTKTMNTTYPNYNFIFKEGKLMVDSNVDKDVDGDGKPDFNDPDGDGCPDLNIKWKDDSGNWVVINGDRDYDGIPDLNIDSDGDGIPDLNIDTDHDGKPDINLVILKKTDWKPTKCVVQSATVKEEYCTGTNLKPQINVDTDNDNIPNINIDTNGDMKADINIDINKDNIADVNLNTIETWKPNKDYKHQNFLYDTMDSIKPYLNIDTNGDNCPDINLDMDQDGIADLNIDTDDDKIPNVNIDSTGNGKADMNLDTNDDGIPDENIIEITEWKPDKKVGDICTMVITQNTELEDNGVKVEKPDGTSFLPNFALKVEDVTNTKQTEITTDAKEFIEEKQEVKKVYDVKLLKDGVEVKPDGMLKVKIPYEGINNPILIRKNNHGSYEKIHYTIEQGYLVYETEELGIVSIIGDKETNTSVMGTYTPNIGGALTGDETGIHLNLLLMFISFLVLMILKSNKQKDTFQ